MEFNLIKLSHTKHTLGFSSPYTVTVYNAPTDLLIEVTIEFMEFFILETRDWSWRTIIVSCSDSWTDEGWLLRDKAGVVALPGQSVKST
jgi:hypothetical protein